MRISLERRLCLPVLAAFAALSAVPGVARASSLDVSTSYRMRAISYSNLDLQAPSDNHSFISQDADLSMFVRGIQLLPESPDQTMDVGLSLRAIGIAGSTGPVVAPFGPAASYYPNVNFIPFIENGYVKLHEAFGKPVEATIGQQNFNLGSGMLLSDDGAGMAGINTITQLPFWDTKLDVFIFEPRNSQSPPSNGLMDYGFTFDLPTDGMWQFSELVEKDKSTELTGSDVEVNSATRYFSDARYQINAGPFLFDGEGAMERGSANPDGNPNNLTVDPTGGRVLYEGDAEVARAKWRQEFGKMGEGIARISFSRGSGYSGKTATTDESFFPAHGHQYDGLERSGFGDFFGATPYSGFGGKSSSTASGLPSNLSGIDAVGLGFTPPAYRGIMMDFDYFLFQAERNTQGPDRTIGREYDLRFRYAYRDKLSVALALSRFTAGAALNPGAGAHKYTFEVAGRF